MNRRALWLRRWSLSMGAALVVLAPVSSAQPRFVVAGFDLMAPLARWELPVSLREVSGLAAFSDGQVLAHGDERAVVFAVDYRTGRVVREWEMGSPVVRGDFEGIALAGDRVTLMTSDGTLISGTLPATGSVIAPLTVEESGLGRRCELEGLTASARGQWVLPCKTLRRPDRTALFTIYEWTSATGADQAAPITISLGRQKRPMAPSAVEQTSSGTFIVLFGSTPAIGEFTRDGQTRSLVALDRRAHPQPEGLALAPDGRLLIADEAHGASGRGRLTVYGRVAR